MCLQWCYVRGWIIDNDLPCAGCPAYGRSPAASCDSCTHRCDGERGPLCALTRLPLPDAGGCCHHNAAAGAGEPIIVAVDDVTVAPWVLAAHRAATPAELLAGHHSAPELELRGGRAWLRLDCLAVPFVYGVTADAWEMAVALPEPEPIPDAPPHFAAALDALEALHAGGDPAPAHARLLALLAEAPLETLPDYWRGTVRETLALLEEREALWR
jgi:hypothetical protein